MIELTASVIVIAVKAITEALQFLATSAYDKAVIATDSMSTLQKIQRGLLLVSDNHVAVLSCALRSSGQ